MHGAESRGRFLLLLLKEKSEGRSLELERIGFGTCAQFSSKVFHPILLG